MSLTPRAVALGLAALLAMSAAPPVLAQMQSPTSPRQPDCTSYPPTSSAYRDCLAGHAPTGPSGREGTSPNIGQLPGQPGVTTPGMPGGTNPGMVPGQPTPGVPATPGVPSVPGTGTGAPSVPGGTTVPGTGR